VENLTEGFTGRLDGEVRLMAGSSGGGGCCSMGMVFELWRIENEGGNRCGGWRGCSQGLL
jgi:hypothetical protein